VHECVARPRPLLLDGTRLQPETLWLQLRHSPSLRGSPGRSVAPPWPWWAQCLLTVNCWPVAAQMRKRTPASRALFRFKSLGRFVCVCVWGGGRAKGSGACQVAASVSESPPPCQLLWDRCTLMFPSACCIMFMVLLCIFLKCLFTVVPLHLLCQGNSAWVTLSLSLLGCSTPAQYTSALYILCLLWVTVGVLPRCAPHWAAGVVVTHARGLV
jgi:hypothetical protein